MRLRTWLGTLAVFAIAAAGIVWALVVHARDTADFQRMQRNEATRAAHQVESMATLSIGRLVSAAAFFSVEGRFTPHEFHTVARSLLRDAALSGTSYVSRVQGAAERRRYERRQGFSIVDRRARGLRRAATRRVYYPVTYISSARDPNSVRGYDLGADPYRATVLAHARDSGQTTASPVVRLLASRADGVAVYVPIYRDRAPTRSVAQRRRSLTGYAAGAFRLADLLAAATGAIPRNDEVQLRQGRRLVAGARGVEDGARAPVRIADQTWLLVLRDPDTPALTLPLLMAGVGISLAALLGALVVTWTRNERMQELQRQAGEDPLTGLRNRRRFESDLKTEIARSRREGRPAALLMLDLDDFKAINDSRGHPGGDEAIREVASILRGRMRESDLLARLGGDEFAIIAPDCGLPEAEAIAASLADSIRDEATGVEGKPVTASIGIAPLGAGADTDLEAVVAQADSAMYAAKAAGRDTVRVYGAGTGVGVAHRRPSV